MKHLTVYLALVLSAMLAARASAQQVVSTFSTGAPGDPFQGPTRVALDKSGNVFVSDTGNHRVRRIDKQTGAVTTIAGTGTGGYSGDGGPAVLAQLDCPKGLAFDSLGDLYIADQCQNVVRKVSNGIITTFAGNGTADTCVLPDGVPANQTSVVSPYQVAIDRADNVFIAGIGCPGRVRRVDAASGLISTTNYLFYGNVNDSIVFDNAGSLLISENAVAICSPVSGNLLTGDENCSNVVYGATNPSPQAVDQAGNLYFIDDPCDGGGGCFAIYKATPGPDGQLSSGSFVLYAGIEGSRGYSGDGGPPLDATFNNPRGLTLDGAGNLFIADTGNNVVRLVSSGPTPPLLTGVPPNPSKDSSATFFFSADSSIASFECTLDQFAPAACISGVAYQSLADGSHTFSVVGRSSSGTPSNAASYTWLVDTTPPPVPSIDSHPSNPSGTANASFTFSDTEADVRFICGLDGVENFCSGPDVLTGLADGSHVFSVKAQDAAGNRSAANTFAWTIHTVTPPAPHTDSAPPVLTNNKVSSFAFSDSQAGVTFACQLDGQASTACVSPITFVGLPDGPHAFAVVATDAASGRSSLPATYAWTVDTTPPNVEVASAIGVVTIPAASLVRFNSGSADVVAYQCSLDGAAFSSCSSPFNQSVSSQGTHSLAVRAIDAAGNVGENSTSWSVTYCRCTLFGNYTNPAFNQDELVQSSPDGQFKVEAAINGLQGGDISLIRASDNTVAYRFTVPANYTAGWQFSPDSTHFWYLTGPSYTTFGDYPVTVLDLTTSSPTQILKFSLGSATSAILNYSPTGSYLMTSEITSTARTAISVYRIGGVSQGVLVHSTELSVALYGPETDGSVVSWGFNQSPFGEPETAFMYAWNAGQNLFGWNVVNLATGKQVISQTSTAISAYWQFNPCGNIIAFVNQSSLNGEQVDLFSVDDGVHLGETSFPLQAVTLTSQPSSKDSILFQEVATISNPQQTIVIATDPTCNPNTPAGSSRLVAPVAPRTNTSPVTVTFSTVTQAGGTGVSSASTGNAPPAGFELGNPPVYFDVATSASYTGTIVLCFSYAGITFNGAPRLFHSVNGAWVDVTVSVDTAHQTICGTVTSLSPFAIFSTPSTPPDTTPPVVKAPANITVPATEAGGARGSAWPALAAFLAGAVATDLVDPSPTALPPQVAGSNVDTSTLFPCGTTVVTFRYRDAGGNIGTATASVTVVVGAPKISGQVVGRGTLAGGSLFFDVKLANVGTGNARKLALDLVLGVPLKGAGLIKTVSPTRPVVIGNFDVGSTQTVRVVFSVPSSVKQFLLTAGGTMFNVEGQLELFAVTQVVNP